MRRHIAHEGEAPGLPACVVASVRLRLSVVDRLLLALRWTLVLAGAVVVLWIGSALLAAPASAATVPAAAVSVGALRGGLNNSLMRPQTVDKKKPAGEKKKSGDKADKPEKKKSGDKSDKPEKKKSGEKADKPEKKKSGDKADKPEKKKSGEKADKPEKKKSGEKADKPEKKKSGDKADKPEKKKSGDKADKLEKKKSGDKAEREKDENGGVAEESEELLRQRIAFEKSRDQLGAAKRERAAGELTNRQYRKQEAAHKAVGKQLAAEREDVSRKQRWLVHTVVEGQEQLAGAEKRLAAEKRKVAAGNVSRAEHRKHVSAYERLRTKVYATTDRLMNLTDRDTGVDPAEDLDGRGAAGGCGADGAFVECGSVIETASGKQDTDRCMALSGLSGGCGVTTSAGGAKASASCDLTGSDRGCVSNATGRGDDGTKTVAAARCEGKVRGCAQYSIATADGGDAECRSGGGKCTTRSAGPFLSSAPDERTRTVGSCTGVCEVDSTADRYGAESGCSTEAGRCYSRSNDLDQDAFGVGNGPGGAGEQGGSARAVCTAADGCGTATEVAREDGEGVEAVADIDCGGVDCTGRAATFTDAGRKVWVSPETLERWAAATSADEQALGKPGSAAEAGALCTVSASGCSAISTSDSDGADAGGHAEVAFDCERADCTGNAVTRTAGSVHGVDLDAVRKAGDRTTCEVADGGCEVGSGTEVERTVQQRPTGAGGTMVPTVRLSAASTSDTQLECERESCVGSAKSTTRGAASGDVRGVRGSAGKSSCDAAGAGAECATTSNTVVEDRDPAEAREAGLAAVSGPVSVSESGVSVDCDGGDSSCRVAGYAGTSARDTGVTPHGRGTSADLECTVSGGDCGGQATSASSSAADHVVIDPRTGKPLTRQPRTGPSSASSSEAYLVCDAGTRCSGSVRTSGSAWDGAVDGGRAHRTVPEPASCTGAQSGGCEARSVSHASTGPGAVLALAGDPSTVNTKRLPAGPSAASASGAVLSCEGGQACTGTVRSKASAIDPGVSEEPRGSYSTGSCIGVRGGDCVAVTNSGSSTGPDANVIAPVMQQRSTDNATVTEGTVGDQAPAGEQVPAGEQGPQQPATPPAPSAPGSAANSGGPTVPGASSWSMADAELNCTGSAGCSGTTRTTAGGTDGPVADNGAGGARGPPAPTSDTASCATGESACVARSGSVTGSGQVAADMIAEQQDETARELAEQARQARKAARKAAQVAARPGATAKQEKAARQAKAAARELRKAAREAAAEAAKPVHLADVVTAQLDAAAEQAAAQAKQARADAAKATRVAAGKGATAKQEKKAKAARAAARSARQAAREAARLAKLPIRGATAVLAESTATAQCSGPGCVAGTTAGTRPPAGWDRPRPPHVAAPPRTGVPWRATPARCSRATPAAARTGRTGTGRPVRRSTAPTRAATAG